jgi:hypothetical protein
VWLEHLAEREALEIEARALAAAGS